MRNKYLENLNKVEFVVTNACTGKCKRKREEPIDKKRQVS